MVETSVNLTGDIFTGLDKFEKLVREKVLLSGAAAMANVIYEEAQSNAERNKKTGLLGSAIYRAYSPEKSGENSQMYRISWNKVKAPHGHLIEFGTSRAPAFPFLRPAFGRVGDAIKAGTERMTEKMDEIKATV